MKKLFLLFSCAIGLSFAQAQTTINLNSTSGLYLALKEQNIDFKSLKSLVLAGTMSAKDFVVLRDSLINLTELDLSDAKIKAYEGSDGPAGSTGTMYAANTIPQKAFSQRLVDMKYVSLSLLTLKLPASITAIDELAFSGCQNLLQLEIPYAVSSITGSAFLGIPTAVSVNTTSTYFATKDSILYSKDMTTLYWCNIKKTGSFTIPNTVTSVGDYAFGYSLLNNITIPTSVQSLGEAAFFSTENLLSLSLPESITTIPTNLLQSSSVTSITIPPTVTTIDASFAIYSNLASITIPSSVTSIGKNAFYGCTKLKKAIIKAKISTISESMFNYCTALEMVQLPYGITSIDANAFYSCSSLRKVNIPRSVSSIGNWAFSFCSNASFIVANPIPDKISLGTSVFNFKKELSTLFVPKGAKTAYQKLAQWKDFLRIVELDKPLFDQDTVYLDAKEGITKFDLSNEQTEWTATLIQASKWLTVTNQPATQTSTPSVELTALANTGAARSETVYLSDGAFLSQPIVVIQDTAIATVKTMKDTTISKSAISKKWLCEGFFNYKGKGQLTYSVSSSAPSIATAILNGKGFAVVPYSKGEASITLTASSSLGATASVSFLVTVSDDAATNCNASVSATTTALSSPNSSTATATAIATGTPPFTYKWNDGCSDQTAYNLAAGIHWVVITDSLGCSARTRVTVEEPKPIILNFVRTAPTCSKNDGTLKVVALGGNSSFTYKWDGGETSSQITNKGAGIYSVTVTDASGSKASQTYILNDSLSADVFVDSLQGSRCSKTSGKIYTSVYGGTAPYTYAWSNGATTQDIDNLKPQKYSVTVTDKAGCKTIQNATVPSKRIKQPRIALVTVGDGSKKNVVVWLKEKTDAIAFYTIYRESDRNTFVAVGQVRYDSLSVFVDQDANPLTQSYRYRISAQDSCKNETPQSREFKTMNIKKRKLDNAVYLSWDDYEGDGVYEFAVERQNADGSWGKLAEVPASKRNFVDNAPLEKQNYRISVVFDEITASALKSDSGPFSQSLSNMSEASLVDQPDATDDEVIVYPNPTSDVAHISFTGKSAVSSVVLTDISGREVVVPVTSQTATHITISVHGLSKGCYTLQIPQAKHQKSLLLQVK